MPRDDSTKGEFTLIGTEDQLASLLGFIRRMDGLHTYPLSEEDGQITLLNGCYELERLGLIVRDIDDPAHIHWEAK